MNPKDFKLTIGFLMVTSIFELKWSLWNCVLSSSMTEEKLKPEFRYFGIMYKLQVNFWMKSDYLWQTYAFFEALMFLEVFKKLR